MELIRSPWAEIFESFGRSIRHHAILVAPFITKEPLARLATSLGGRNHPKIELLTNFAVDSLLQGSVDTSSVASFCRSFPNTKVRHLPGLHAKAYVADDEVAIITSGNLTHASLHLNYEYGIQISDSNLVRQIARDLRDYGALGSEVSLAELDQLTQIADALRARHAETLRAARLNVKKEFELQIEVAHEALRYLRAKPGESTSSIFSRTIVYVLGNGPLTTDQIHPLVEAIHPDLCDNTVDRVINGVHFGKRWKHWVRSAQQRLKAKGLVKYSDDKWFLAQEN